MLVIKDVALWIWGAEDLLGPRAPGLRGAVEILGIAFPEYDLFLIVVGPLVLGALWLLLKRTRWGTLVRAATEDREMVGALGVNQKWLFTAVFALGAFLAGLGGALQIPREPAQLFLDLGAISDAFVVVVVGGMGSIPGAFLAALLIGEIKAFCIGLGTVEFLGHSFSFSKLTLVAEFIVMAIVLVLRPWGLLGKPWAIQRTGATQSSRRSDRRAPALNTAAIAARRWCSPRCRSRPPATRSCSASTSSCSRCSRRACTSSWGRAGWSRSGTPPTSASAPTARRLLLKKAAWPMEAALAAAPVVAAIGAAVFGWFCVRLSGVYLAMLTLAFAQIAWSIVYQWDAFTGGSNGIVGVWPAPWLASRPAFYLAHARALRRRHLPAARGCCSRRSVTRCAPGAIRRCGATRSASTCSACSGARSSWSAASPASRAGSSPSPRAASRPTPRCPSRGRSTRLVMVLLGGVQTLSGPVVGAAVFTWLQDTIARNTDYWRALLGATILAIVLLFPQGIVGAAARARAPSGARAE